MRRCRICAILTAAALVAAGCAPESERTGGSLDRSAREALRRSAAAEVYQACRNSVVNIGCVRGDEANPNVRHTEFGSGVVLHEAGYVLTNAHILRHGGDLAVGFDGGPEFPARAVAVDTNADLAVLKVDADRRLAAVRLGRSGDLVVGEPVITMGNPFGMGMTVAEGIVSALGRSTKSDFTFYPEMIQTDATTNPGSSGGPLLNVYGELVGLNTTKKLDGDNIAFAIPVDRIRALLPGIIEPEARFGFVVGLEVAADGPARVTGVADGSPAKAAGVRAGDEVTRLGDVRVGGAIDYCLALAEFRGGNDLPLELRRGGGTREVTVTPRPTPPLPARDAGDVEGGLVRARYDGRWDALPDFAALQPAKVETAATFELGDGAGQDGFALRLAGLIDVPADGVYVFYTASDDGSRLHVDDRLVVDNDGLHAAEERRGFVPLAKGKHAIAVTFFERAGEEALVVSWEGPGLLKQPIPASVLSHPKAGG